MTASVPSIGIAGAGRRPLFQGLATLVRKDITEWRRGRRALTVALVTGSVMALTAANSWINARLLEVLPADVDGPAAPLSMAPLDNLMTGVAAQIFILAAIFAVAAVLVREREAGTLAWVAAKPVERHTILISKWISSSLVLAISAVIIPIAVTFATVSVLYGVPDVAPVAIVAVGATAAVVFFAALGLTAAVFLPSQVSVVAAGFAVFVLGPVIGGLVGSAAGWLPTSILDWSAGIAAGGPIGWITPLSWGLATTGLIALGARRLRSVEL
jgi:ABC-type transport system involved in multi-copper enzyme maturation permease subunit